VTGKILVFVGAFWFILDFLWLPPLVGILLSIHVPERRLNHVWPAEFALSAAMISAGILLWRSAARRPSVAEFLIVPSASAFLAIGVLKLFGWM
jgi:hypothetical protein